MATVRLLAGLRAHAPLGAAWLIALLLLVSVERRLSEAHYDLRTAVTSLENDEALDSDEIRLRLVLLRDEQLPVLPRAGSAFLGRATPARASARVGTVVGVPAPRGPPLPSSASLT